MLDFDMMNGENTDTRKNAPCLSVIPLPPAVMPNDGGHAIFRDATARFLNEEMEETLLNTTQLKRADRGPCPVPHVGAQTPSFLFEKMFDKEMISTLTKQLQDADEENVQLKEANVELKEKLRAEEAKNLVLEERLARIAEETRTAADVHRAQIEMFEAKVNKLTRNQTNMEMEKSAAAEKEEKYQRTVEFMGQMLEKADLENAELKTSEGDFSRSSHNFRAHFRVRNQHVIMCYGT